MDEEQKKKLLEETEPPKDQKKILLFDDDDEIREMLHMTLQKEGFAVRSAPTGRRALTMALEFSPDLVITDVMMPGGGGYDDVVRSLRSDENTREIPVLVFSGKDFDSTTKNMIETEPNVKGFLKKPVQHTLMMEIVYKTLGIKSKLEQEMEDRKKNLPDVDMKGFDTPW